MKFNLLFLEFFKHNTNSSSSVRFSIILIIFFKAILTRVGPAEQILSCLGMESVLLGDFHAWTGKI